MGFPLLFWSSVQEIQMLLFMKLSMAAFKIPESIIQRQNINFQRYRFYRLVLGIPPGLLWPRGQPGTPGCNVNMLTEGALMQKVTLLPTWPSLVFYFVVC